MSIQRWLTASHNLKVVGDCGFWWAAAHGPRGSPPSDTAARSALFSNCLEHVAVQGSEAEIDEVLEHPSSGTREVRGRRIAQAFEAHVGEHDMPTTAVFG